MISVIVPVYNTGSYLRLCVESILNQTEKNIEILIVDDGSQQETAGLCDILANEDPRIKVIHKSNGGVSSARNEGLAKAKGEIICFVDSDDTIEPQMFERMLMALESHDVQIAMCDAVTIRPDKPDEADTISDFAQSCVIETCELPPDTLTRLAGSACRCAYKRTDTLLDSQARFPEGLKFSEDRIFNIVAMSQATRIAYLKEPLYNRLIRSGSACFRYYPDMAEQIEKMRDLLIPAVKKCWGQRYVPAYERQIQGHILSAITNYTAFGTGEKIKAQLTNLKKLCVNQSIQDCMQACNTSDMRSKAIISGHYHTLYVIGRLTNIYHKLCKRGQYQA